MSASYVLSLLAALVVVLLGRVLLPLPVRRVARPLRRVEALAFVVGMATLGFHCGAMFATAAVTSVVGAGGVVDAVNALGPASIALYTVPALLVAGALVRPHPIGAVVVAAALLAVGVTMYDGGPVGVHTSTIFASVVLIALVVALTVSGVAHGGAAPRRA